MIEGFTSNFVFTYSVKFALWFACAVGALELLLIIIVWCFLIRAHDNSIYVAGCHLATTGFRKFSYAELKKATNNSSQEMVEVPEESWKGHTAATIKRPIDANKGQVEFLAEVNTIGKLNNLKLHRNVGLHRLLVYDMDLCQKAFLAKHLIGERDLKLQWQQQEA